MPRMEVATHAQYIAQQSPFPLANFNWQLIAEGDSWFSTTSAVLYNQNVLENMYLPRRAAVINCAQAGDNAERMFTRNNAFRDLLQQQWWAAILISASGNDLIDALRVAPIDPASQTLRPLEERILRLPSEVNNSPDAHDYVSAPGFERLAGYLLFWFASLVAWRDEPNSKSRGRPIFLHTYSVPIARPSGALPGSGRSWLYPALRAYEIPEPLHQGVTSVVFGRLRAFLIGLDTDASSGYRLDHVHVFDSAGIPLVAADPVSRKSSGNWINEIHLTTEGARKVGKPFSAFVASRCTRYPMPG